jgi:streptogramin lyase
MKLRHFISAVGLGLGLILILLVGMASADGPDHGGPRRPVPPTPSPLSPTLTAAFTTPCMAPLSSASNAAGGPSVRETGLTPGGTALEVNPDGQGNLWISDGGVSQVWQFNRATSAFTIYNGLHHPADPHRDNNNVWWTDTVNGLLGRINLSASTVTTWTLPAAVEPVGVAIDASGQVWVVDAEDEVKGTAPFVYRFNPNSTEVCSYGVPDGGGGDYIVYNAGNLWFGDAYNSRMVKLDPVAGQFTYWQLPPGSSPEGLGVDGDGNVWWADFGALRRLEPAANRVATYSLPVSGYANMLAISDGAIWFSGSLTGTFGVLDPDALVPTTVVVTSAMVTVMPSCTVLGPGVTTRPLVCTSVASFTPGAFTQAVNTDAWKVYELPSPSALWGIAAPGGVWMSDYGRDKLVNFSYSVYLPIIFK